MWLCKTNENRGQNELNQRIMCPTTELPAAIKIS